MEEEPDDDYVQGMLDAMYCVHCQALDEFDCICTDDEQERRMLGECPKCHTEYDDLDYEYQICSHCRHDAEYFEL